MAYYIIVKVLHMTLEPEEFDKLVKSWDLKTKEDYNAAVEYIMSHCEERKDCNPTFADKVKRLPDKYLAEIYLNVVPPADNDDKAKSEFTTNKKILEIEIKQRSIDLEKYKNDDQNYIPPQREKLSIGQIIVGIFFFIILILSFIFECGGRTMRAVDGFFYDSGKYD